MGIEKSELLNIKGGIKITAALLTSIYKCLNYVSELGKSIGSTIRRIQTNRMC